MTVLLGFPDQPVHRIPGVFEASRRVASRNELAGEFGMSAVAVIAAAVIDEIDKLTARFDQALPGAEKRQEGHVVVGSSEI